MIKAFIPFSYCIVFIYTVHTMTLMSEHITHMKQNLADVIVETESNLLDVYWRQHD